MKKRLFTSLVVLLVAGSAVYAQDKVARPGAVSDAVTSRPGGISIVAFGEDWDHDADSQTPEVHRLVWRIQVSEIIDGYSQAVVGELTRGELLGVLTAGERTALRSILNKAYCAAAAKRGETCVTDDDPSKGIGEAQR